MSPREELSKSVYTVNAAAAETVHTHEEEDNDVYVEQTYLFQDPRGIDALNMEDFISFPVNAWQYFLRNNSPAPRRRTQSTGEQIGWLTSGYTADQRSDSTVATVYHTFVMNDSALAEFERTLSELYNQLMSS